MDLCARAIAEQDDGAVQGIVEQLRLMLHQRIHQLRTGLILAYPLSAVRSEVLERRKNGQERTGVADALRTWRQVVQEIADEEDHQKALQLTKELDRLLQHDGKTRSSYEDAA